MTEAVDEICVTANLQRYHRSGTRGWLEEALKERPAVVFGQELHPKHLGDLPRAHGYTVLEPAVLKSQYWVASWVLARDDLLPEPAGLDLLSPFDSYVAAARLQWPGLGPLTVVSMHASPHPVPLDDLSRWPWQAPTARSGGPSVRNRGRHFYSDLVLEALRVLALDGPVLAAGDLNEARDLDNDHAPATWGEEFFGEAVPRTGLRDVTFGLWGHEQRTQFHPTKRGYQVDVVLATPPVAAAVRWAGIDPAWVDAGPDLTQQADHAPLWFTVERAGRDRSHPRPRAGRRLRRAGPVAVRAHDAGVAARVHGAGVAARAGCPVRGDVPHDRGPRRRRVVATTAGAADLPPPLSGPWRPQVLGDGPPRRPGRAAGYDRHQPGAGAAGGADQRPPVAQLRGSCRRDRHSHMRQHHRVHQGPRVDALIGHGGAGRHGRRFSSGPRSSATRTFFGGGQQSARRTLVSCWPKCRAGSVPSDDYRDTSSAGQLGDCFLVEVVRGMLGWIQRRLDRRAAGASARAEYERLKREWRRRMRRRFLWLGASFAAIAIAFVALAVRWPWLEFTSGLVTGALTAVFVALRESPPGWVEQWLTGSHGEQLTDKELQKLEPAGWRVLRDMKRRGTNVDHVLVGPAGVFVIDSKNLDGRVHCEGDTLSLRRPGARDEGRRTYTTTDPARGVRGQSAEVSELLRKRLGASVWLSGVVVIWAGFEQGVSRGNRMDYVRGDELVTWLRSRDVRLNAEKVDDIARALSPARRRRKS